MTTRRARFTDTLRYEVILSIDNIAVGQMIRDSYSVNLIIGEIARGLSTSQIGVPHNKLRMLKREARKLVAGATNTKPTSWTANVVDDHLVIVTRRGKTL